MNRLLLPIILISSVLFSCCGGDEPPPTPDPSLDPIELELPAHFPVPNIPSDNPMTQAKIDLGKKLFFDKRLSADSTIACASCHLQENAFSDPNAVSVGVEGRTGERNAMSIQNLVFAQFLFWDGRSETLEDQAVEPLLDPREMNISLEELERRLTADAQYPDLFQHAFGGVPTSERFAMAIATFERSVVSYESKYDQYVESQDSTIFSELEWRGLKLFFDETPGIQHPECFHCHGGFNFDDQADVFSDNGLDFSPEPGRAEVTGDFFFDQGKFKVPSLRNVEHTAPYMHDGRFATLEEVMDHYQNRGDRIVGTNPFINSIFLTEGDKTAIIAFLKTLSDPNYLTNPAYQPD
ncbi:cytochrome c peroxidase [Pontibacter sp. G13]|uniref:cytochrome-c peroxidase n=1 Tax=Pontibacter sp. G13 TaxID=3074898 RepID=UPI002889AA15|nr:cytochrome c peroxidase [Pontibacter sp. G13]WNJ20130.1 cytochrome c peroxidase [Pontibacter sp. G13]